MDGKSVRQKSRHYGGVACFLTPMERQSIMPLVMICTTKNTSLVAEEARERGEEATI